MKIGLYFGSFNPVHVGHLIIANHVAYNSDLQQVWFVVSPQNPFKQSAGLLNEYHRFHLIQSAIDGENKLRVSSVEFKLPKPSYTVDTLAYLAEALANGDSTGEIATRFRISAGRVSQLRRELHASWERFHAEDAGEQVAPAGAAA